MWWRLAALGGAAATIACGGGSTAPADEAPFDFEFTDVAGDTVAATANPEALKGIDVLKVSGRIDRDKLIVVLEFAEAPAPWSASGPNSLDGFIDFDPDITGDLKTTSGYYLDLRDNGAGKAALVGVRQRTVTLVKVRFDGTRMEAEIPRTAISSTRDSDNQLQMAVEVGPRGRSPSDRSPNVGSHTLKPPTP